MRLVTPTAERGLFVNAVEVMHCAAEDYQQVLPKCQPGLVGEVSVMVVSLGNHARSNSSIAPWQDKRPRARELNALLAVWRRWERSGCS